MKFTIRIGGTVTGPYDSFTAAFVAFMNGVHALVDAGTTHMILETACWIEADYDGRKRPMLFYDAKEFGYEHGLLDEATSQLASPMPELDPQIIKDEFDRLMDNVIGQAADNLASTLEEAAAILRPATT